MSVSGYRGVLLTNGWDEDARRRAALTFDLDFSDVNDRHRMIFATSEEGKLTRAIESYPELIELVRALKTKYGSKTVVVSNEARELNAIRIRKFKLDEFIDSFVSS